MMDAIVVILLAFVFSLMLAIFGLKSQHDKQIKELHDKIKRLEKKHNDQITQLIENSDNQIRQFTNNSNYQIRQLNQELNKKNTTIKRQETQIQQLKTENENKTKQIRELSQQLKNATALVMAEKLDSYPIFYRDNQVKFSMFNLF